MLSPRAPCTLHEPLRARSCAIHAHLARPPRACSPRPLSSAACVLRRCVSASDAAPTTSCCRSAINSKLMSEKLKVKVQTDIVSIHDVSGPRFHRQILNGRLALQFDCWLCGVEARGLKHLALLAAGCTGKRAGCRLEPAPGTLSPRDRVCTSSCSCSTVEEPSSSTTGGGQHTAAQQKTPGVQAGGTHAKDPGVQAGAKTEDPRGASRGQ